MLMLNRQEAGGRSVTKNEEDVLSFTILDSDS